MAIRFHYQSDSLSPRRVSVPTTSKPFVPPVGTAPALVTKTTEVGCIGSTYLNINANGLGYYRAMRFVGYGNVDAMTSGLSVLCRVIPRFTGFNPSSYGGLFTFNGFTNTPYIFCRALTNGAFQFTGVNADFVQIFNAVSSTTHSFTSGTAVDIVVTWTGTNASNGVKIFVNGTQIHQATASASSNYSDAKGQLFESIIAGAAWPQGELGGFDLNEMVVWNEVIDPTSGGLNLNGSSRSAFVTSTASTQVATLPAVGKVVSGEVYGIDNALTGTRVDANEDLVINTHSYGDPGAQITGDYKPTPVNKVEAGFTFGADASEVGTLVIGCDYPEEDEVEDGVVYDFGNKTGTFGRHIPQTNQYFAPLEVQAEIFAVLNGDADLTTLLGANKIFDFVPDKKAFPYVTINALPFIQRDNATNDGMECEFQINVWYSPGASGQTSRGNKPVQLIQKRIDELLQHRSLCVNGWNTLQLRRTFIDILVESDNVTRQGIQRFKLFLGSKD